MSDRAQPAPRTRALTAVWPVVLSLGVAWTAFAIHHYLWLRQRLVQEIGHTAEGLALSLAPFLDRSDLQGCQALLQALEAQPDAVQAVLFGADGRVATRFARDGERPEWPPVGPPGQPSFTAGRLRVFRDVLDPAGRPLGTLFVEMSTAELAGAAQGLAVLSGGAVLLGLLLLAGAARAGPRSRTQPTEAAATPRAIQGLSSAPAPGRLKLAPPPSERGVATVLVIDDKDESRELLARGLAREGFHVVTAADWEQGLLRARELRPDLITLDALMPGTDGWSVLRALKDDPEIAHIPVVMTTLMSERVPREPRRVDYLAKPVERGRLKELVHRQQLVGGGASVLLVTADETLRSELHAALVQLGFLVLEAASGEAALELLAGALPDLVLLDHDDSRRSAQAFVEALHAQPESSEIPVVVLSAAPLAAEERAALEDSVPRVFQKSALSSHELACQIRGLLGGPERPAVRRADAS